MAARVPDHRDAGTPERVLVARPRRAAPAVGAGPRRSGSRRDRRRSTRVPRVASESRTRASIVPASCCQSGPARRGPEGPRRGRAVHSTAPASPRRTACSAPTGSSHARRARGGGAGVISGRHAERRRGDLLRVERRRRGPPVASAHGTSSRSIAAVLEVLGADVGGIVEVGDGAGDLADAHRTPPGERAVVDEVAPALVGVPGEGQEPRDRARRRRARSATTASRRSAPVGESSRLATRAATSADDSPGTSSGSGAVIRTRRSNRSSSGALEPASVPVALRLGATAIRFTDPARARIRARDELEAGREGERHRLSRDAHHALLERLAQRVERGGRELAELVEEQHAAVREGDLAGAWAGRSRRRRAPAWMPCGAAPGTGGPRSSRPPSGSPAAEWMRVTSSASVVCERREDRGEAPGEHGLARARRSA